MANINSLTYLVYSILTLASNNKPTTDPSLNGWPIESEPPVTEDWNQEPHHVTQKYNEDCPAGERWSDCDAACEHTCENVGKPVICPRMCIPGCVCERPGEVRGPNKECIPPPLCPAAEVDPDEIISAEKEDPNIPGDTLNSGGCPSQIECSRNCKRQGHKYGLCSGPDKRNCHCYNKWSATEDPNIPRVDPEEPSRAKVYWPVDQDPKIQTVDPDETLGAEQDIDPRCPPNEVYRKCDTVCVQECVCKPGYARGRHGSCVKPQPHSPSNGELKVQADIDPDMNGGCPDMDACFDYCGPLMGYCLFPTICVCV